MRKNKNCVKAETETYKIQKLTYIADFQVLKTDFIEVVWCTRINTGVSILISHSGPFSHLTATAICPNQIVHQEKKYLFLMLL